MEDRSVPLSWGQQLFAAARPPKNFVALQDGEHADLARHGLIGAMQDFLRTNLD